MNPDVVVVGAGIIGCAIARQLANDGRRVVIVERGEPGHEASWAAGGILTPVHLAGYPGPLAELCVASAKLYPALVGELRAESSTDPEYRVTGMLMLARDESDRRAIDTIAAWKRERDQPAVAVEDPHAMEPALSPELRGGLLLQDVAQVRNNRMTRALAEAAAKHGVEFRLNCDVTGLLRVPGRVTGVKTSKGDILADEVVLSAGAWSWQVLLSVGIELRCFPVRGQMVLLHGPPDVVKRVILWGDRYLVPRADGHILAGSTMEEAGFDKSVTAGGIGGILAGVLAVAPELAKLPVARTWAGLRPGTHDRLPYIGRPPGIAGLVLATGHFRNGILLAPVTAQLVSELIAGRPPSIDLAPFRADR